MPTTPKFGLRYPAASSAVNVPQDIANLATDVDNVLNRPYVQMRQTVAQSIPVSTWTAITFTAEDVDSHNGHDTALNTSRYTVQVSGVYLVVGQVYWAIGSTGTRRGLQIRKNGSTATAIPGGTTWGGAPSSVDNYSQVSAPTLVSLAAGDYIELYAWQNTAGALSTAVSGATPPDVITALTAVRIA